MEQATSNESPRDAARSNGHQLSQARSHLIVASRLLSELWRDSFAVGDTDTTVRLASASQLASAAASALDHYRLVRSVSDAEHDVTTSVSR